LLIATRRGAPPLTRTTRAGLWVLAALVGLAVVQFGYYNLTFVQFQGRYLYPALIPLGLTAADGLWGWARFVARFLPARWHGALAWLPLVVMGWLPLLAVYALFWILVPNPGRRSARGGFLAAPDAPCRTRGSEARPYRNFRKATVHGARVSHIKSPPCVARVGLP